MQQQGTGQQQVEPWVVIDAETWTEVTERKGKPDKYRMKDMVEAKLDATGAVLCPVTRPFNNARQPVFDKEDCAKLLASVDSVAKLREKQVHWEKQYKCTFLPRKVKGGSVGGGGAPAPPGGGTPAKAPEGRDKRDLTEVHKGAAGENTP